MTEPAVDRLVQDEFAHNEAAPDVPFWTENLLFQAWDDDTGVGFYHHQGSMGWGNPRLRREVLWIFLPGERLAVQKSWAPGTSEGGFVGASSQFIVVEPFRRWTATYEGAGQLVASEELAEGALRDGKVVPISLEVEISALSDPWYPGEHDQALEEQLWAANHYEQHLRIKGSVSVDGQQYAIDSTGYRDHSWGQRHFAGIRGHTWLMAQFPSGRAINAIEVLAGDPAEGCCGPVDEQMRLLRGATVAPDGRVETLELPVGCLHRVLPFDRARRPRRFEFPMSAPIIDVEIRGLMTLIMAPPNHVIYGLDRRESDSIAYFGSPLSVGWDGEVGSGYLEWTTCAGRAFPS